MPPKARFTRERIEEAAFQLAREKGLEAVAAREVAKSMGMTVTPIFTYFSGMDELKRSIKDRARREFVDYLRGSLDYFPAFKEFGMRWMRYAGENPNLYRILMGPEEGPASLEELLDLFREILAPITDEIADTFGISKGDARRVLGHMMVYTNGLSAFLLRGGKGMSEEEISVAISQVCVSLAVRAKLLDGSAGMAGVREMLSSNGISPEKKHHSAN